VICYFAGITNNDNYKEGKLNDDLNEKKFKEKLLKYGADFEGIDKVLAECEMSLPSRVFGCTGWKGWIKIKKIKPIEGYCFGNKLNLPYGIYINKNDSNKKIEIFQTKEEYNSFINKKYKGSWKDKQKEFKKEYSVWFFDKPYFYGKFEITFEIEKEILEPIFYPLLTFIEKYGFLGGKWNIGYGRVKIEKIDLKNKNREEKEEWRIDNFEFNNFYNGGENKFPRISFYRLGSKNHIKYIYLVKSCKDWDELEDKDKKKIYYYDEQISKNTYKDIIIELIKIKAFHRHDISSSYKRHNIFGEGGKNAKGTKIIPWIYEENGRLKGGFVSIAGILGIGGN